MKLTIELEQAGRHSKLTVDNPVSNLPELLNDPAQYDRDKQKIAETLMAMAFGFATDRKKLLLAFDLLRK